MSSKYRVGEDAIPHFVTFTVVGWVDLPICVVRQVSLAEKNTKKYFVRVCGIVKKKKDLTYMLGL